MESTDEGDVQWVGVKGSLVGTKGLHTAITLVVPLFLRGSSLQAAPAAHMLSGAGTYDGATQTGKQPNRPSRGAGY
jgi:hypothetical protein